MSLGGLDPVPKIDPRCKWYHLLSDSTRRRTYSSVITDQQRRDRSQCIFRAIVNAESGPDLVFTMTGICSKRQVNPIRHAQHH